MGSNLERERRSKMYKGSDGTLTTRDSYMKLMRVVARKRLAKKSPWNKMYGSSKRVGGPRKGGR
jgi:hypothetical protein